MQTTNNTEQDNLDDLPFKLIENRDHQDESNADYTHRPSWNFEVGTHNKTIPLTLIAKHDQAALSDLVPIAHQICDMINHLAIENESQNGTELACRKGCSSCCSYMVSLSSAEAFYLQKHILALPAEKRRPILHSFLLAARKIASNKIPLINDSPTSHSQSLEDISSWYQKLNIKCPFLKDNACSDYNARPLVCREHLVTSSPKACNPSSAMLTNVIDLPISTAEILMHISNKVESTIDEAVILPLTMIWCNSNAKRSQQKYPTTILAEHLINTISIQIPALN